MGTMFLLFRNSGTCRLFCLLTMLTALSSVFYSASARATVFTISTSDNPVRPGMDNQGWWGDNFANFAVTSDNYLAGPTTRGYFSFDLSGVVGSVVSATLQVRRYDTSSGSTLFLHDVGTSAIALSQRGVIDNAIYADLGTGTSYGSFLAGPGDTLDLMSFSLNAAGVADANSALGTFFSIGTRSINGTHFGNSFQEPGNGGPGFIQQLVLETGVAAVPEPSTLLLLGFGLAGLGFFGRRKMVA